MMWKAMRVIALCVWLPGAVAEEAGGVAALEAHEQATGQPFVSPGVRPIGITTTDMWDIGLDAYQPYSYNQRYYT